MDDEELERKFQDFAVQAAAFTRQLIGIGVPREDDKSKLAESNLETAKTIFGKWCIEIFVILYNLGPVGFEQLRRYVKGITPGVLSEKLKMMEGQGLVRRDLVGSRPPGVRYSLTENGVTVARLGEPVFLYVDFQRRTSRNVPVSKSAQRPEQPQEDANARKGPFRSPGLVRPRARPATHDDSYR